MDEGGWCEKCGRVLIDAEMNFHVFPLSQLFLTDEKLQQCFGLAMRTPSVLPGLDTKSNMGLPCNDGNNMLQLPGH